MLRETITEADLAYHWNNNPLFRSAASQRILYQAAKYEMSQKGIATKAVREVPQVQRPGSPLERGNERDYQLDRLNAKLNASGSARDAANLLIARRAVIKPTTTGNALTGGGGPLQKNRGIGAGKPRYAPKTGPRTNDGF